MKKTKLLSLMAVFAILFGFANTVPSFAMPTPDTIVNPSFETGDFQGWTPDAGCVIVDPDEGGGQDPAPDGTYYAKQTASGDLLLTVLSQEFWAPVSVTTCSVDIGWVGNGARAAVIQVVDQPQTLLDFVIDGVRTDHPLFWWDTYTLDIGPLGGNTVEIRFEASVQTLVAVKEILGESGRVLSVKAEFEDLRAALAQLEQVGVELSLTALKRLVEQTASGPGECSLPNVQAEYLP